MASEWIRMCWTGTAAMAVFLATASARAQPVAMPATVLPDLWTSSPVVVPACEASPSQGTGITDPMLTSPVTMTGVMLSPSNPGMSSAGVMQSGGSGQSAAWPEPWTWQVVPTGLMYPNYLAGPRESRLAAEWVHEKNLGWLWDGTLGGHVGLLRYGSQDPLWPQGWQIDLEGAAFPRLDSDRNLVSADFRCGIPLTVRDGPWEGKFAVYHLSSHLADEFLLAHPGTPRINYSRNALVLGVGFRPVPDLRLYSEAGWAFYTDGGSKPWEFQFGAEFSPARPSGLRGAPFVAVNGRIRQEVNYGGGLTTQAGWQWRGQTGHLARFGLDYFNGKSDQYQFLNDHEEQLGLGFWYDF